MATWNPSYRENGLFVKPTRTIKTRRVGQLSQRRYGDAKRALRRVVEVSCAGSGGYLGCCQPPELEPNLEGSYRLRKAPRRSFRPMGVIGGAPRLQQACFHSGSGSPHKATVQKEIYTHCPSILHHDSAMIRETLKDVTRSALNSESELWR